MESVFVKELHSRLSIPWSRVPVSMDTFPFNTCAISYFGLELSEIFPDLCSLDFYRLVLTKVYVWCSVRFSDPRSLRSRSELKATIALKDVRLLALTLSGLRCVLFFA